MYQQGGPVQAHAPTEPGSSVSGRFVFFCFAAWAWAKTVCISNDGETAIVVGAHEDESYDSELFFFFFRLGQSTNQKEKGGALQQGCSEALSDLLVQTPLLLSRFRASYHLPHLPEAHTPLGFLQLPPFP